MLKFGKVINDDDLMIRLKTKLLYNSIMVDNPDNQSKVKQLLKNCEELMPKDNKWKDKRQNKRREGMSYIKYYQDIVNDIFDQEIDIENTIDILSIITQIIFIGRMESESVCNETNVFIQGYKNGAGFKR